MFPFRPFNVLIRNTLGSALCFHQVVKILLLEVINIRVTRISYAHAANAEVLAACGAKCEVVCRINYWGDCKGSYRLPLKW